MFSSSAPGYVPEMERIISQLERGTLVTTFSWRKKAEQKTLALRKETGQIIWTTPATASKSTFEGAVNLAEIKEIREGKFSKDFERWPEDAKRVENSQCFVIFYGCEFKLKVLSVAAVSEQECVHLLRGLRHLFKECVSASYPRQVQRWLRKEFASMKSPRETVNLKDLKNFFPRISYKMSTYKLRERFNEVDSRKAGEIGFEDFAILYKKIIFEEESTCDIFNKLSHYSASQKIMDIRDVKKFFINEQKEKCARDDVSISQFICDFLKDPQRDIREPYFTVSEFLDFLFSKQNDLWNPAKDTVYQDMSKPLSHYWISSSHNTYLTGDQLSSESSVEAYVRCLRMGCRCVELDCWDGTDGMPIIYHGHTLTTKIKFIDVIRTIKEHAFSTSDYPVILSLEDNCSLPQQRKMATVMQEMFGDMLLTYPVEKGETKLPSPQSLRGKIILKHKKLPEGQEDSSITIKSDSTEIDLRNSVKSGIMYLEDRVEKEWNPHFFVLTQNKLFYTHRYTLDQESEKSEDCGSFQRPKINVPNKELHFNEKWFHGRLQNGREGAEQLLRAYSHLGNGTFLVRFSEEFVGEYSLSFWRNGKVNHCPIFSKQDKQQIKYYITNAKYFDSLYSLIAHYRNSPLVTAEFSITMQEPVPQPNLHETEEWYHKNTGKNQAEEILRRINIEGAFLVRPSETDADCYTISFQAGNKIEHCRIKLEGRLYTIGIVEFGSLVELINYYQNHEFYYRMKLSHPVSEECVRRMAMEQDDDTSYATSCYVDTSTINQNVTVKAIYDYKAKQPKQLSFCKHAIITNVCKNTDRSGWWKGDYGGFKQHYFLHNYVKEIEKSEPQGIDEGSGESMLQGFLDMNGAQVDFMYNAECAGIECIISIQAPTAPTIFKCGVKSQELALEWYAAIQEVAKNKETQHLELEQTFQIAKEMSKLIIYCRSISFNLEKAKQCFTFYEMSSFSETKAEKLICQQERKLFLKYHQVQLSRVYPKGQRMNSSNYNPINIWNCGSQMVALNFQTGDKPMQLNQAKFRDNGNCGYLLKPEFMSRDNFDPYDKNTSVGVNPVIIFIRILAGRHLYGSKKGIASPFVEVEIVGAPFDAGVKLTTKRIPDNGLYPKWNEDVCQFVVANPSFAFLRFMVQHDDVVGEPNFIGQATYPVTCLRTGYRSVWLQNAYSEDLELDSLLIHIIVKNLPLVDSS